MGSISCTTDEKLFQDMALTKSSQLVLQSLSTSVKNNHYFSSFGSFRGLNEQIRLCQFNGRFNVLDSVAL